jgi:hypothetical protein
MKTIWITLAAVLVILVGGCVPATSTPVEFSPDSVHTQVAETLVAEITLSAGSTAVARLTELARPTATDFPFLLTRLPTSTAVPPSPAPSTSTPTPTPTEEPTATETPAPCDSAALLSESPAQGNALLPPGASFRKTWLLLNQGRCIWSPDYLLVFSSGDWMGDNVFIPLPGFVPPGDTVEITARLTAPLASGSYRSEWWLENSEGEAFGVGPAGTDPLVVDLRVSQAVLSGRYPLDFAADLCAALWDSSEGSLECAGSGDLPGAASLAVASRTGEGFVGLLEAPVLETRREDEPALWFRADGLWGSWIRGEYPPLFINQGHHFVAEFGCMAGNRNCEALFTLDYRLPSGITRSLGVWEESFDNRTTFIDIDLSGLAGQWVELVLTVTNRSRTGPSEAFLFVPRVERRN